MHDKVIVITGSSQGIGLGLAREFLRQECKVVVNSRREEKIEAIVNDLAKNDESKNVFGFAADVTDFNALSNLWKKAIENFGKVDIWINNAGINHATLPCQELSTEAIEQVIKTNVLGAIYGCNVAIAGMQKQGFGFIYNMEGMGSNGMVIEGQSIYSTSKAALTHYTKSIIKEQKSSTVKVGYIRPGMVMTDLLLKENISEYQDYERFKKITNILADQVETVAPYIVGEVLKNQKHGARINWLTTRKTLWRFLIAPFNNRDLFTEEKR